MKRRSIILAVTLRTAPWALLLAGLLPARGQPFDLILRGGRVIDGTGNPAARVDVGIRDGKIAALGGLTAATALHVFDVTGKIVCPGFIDLHSHAEGGLGSSDPRRRAAPNLVSQGITSVCVNPDGGGPWPIGAQRRNFEERRIGPNALLMVGHGTVRRLAMPTDFKRAATPAEVTRMRELVRLGLQEGAWGMSGGLEYVPGIWSTTEELVELVREIAAVGGAYIVHQRSESTDPRWYRPSVDPAGMPTLLDAVRETIHIGETTGATVVWSHAKVMGAHYWGASTAAIRLIAEARARGVDVWADQYPYNSTGGDGAVVLVPAWAIGDDPFSSARGRAAGPKLEFSYAENLRKAMADPAQAEKIRRDVHHEIARRGGPENIVVFDYPDRSYLGRNLAELAKQEKIGPFEMALELQYRGFRDRPGGSRLRGFSVWEDDVDAFMRQPWTATSTDAGVVLPEDGPDVHARYYGSYPRKLRHHALDRRVVAIEEAIRASTSLPAQILGLRDRGLVREGLAADLVVFDPATVRDRATFTEPHQLAAGIELVLVNGQAVVENSRVTGTLPGRVLLPPRRSERGRP